MKILFIVGPTASGKTELGIKICRRIKGEIISADSRQIYKYMDIGTAKPLNPEVPHHLIDIKDPKERYSAYEFYLDAKRCIEDILKRGKRPVVVGGTGLYIRALTEGLFPQPRISPEVKERLLEELKEKGIEALYHELEKVDPEAASKIHPRDRQRIVRALEVYRGTGIPISQFWKKKIDTGIEPVYIGIGWERKELYRRIEERVKRMVESGWVDEVRNLLSMGYSPSDPGFSSVGYREVVGFIEGRYSEEIMIKLIVKKTKEYARRQIMWFRRLPVHWLSPDTLGSLSGISD